MAALKEEEEMKVVAMACLGLAYIRTIHIPAHTYIRICIYVYTVYKLSHHLHGFTM